MEPDAVEPPEAVDPLLPPEAVDPLPLPEVLLPLADAEPVSMATGIAITVPEVTMAPESVVNESFSTKASVHVASPLLSKSHTRPSLKETEDSVSTSAMLTCVASCTMVTERKGQILRAVNAV